MTLESIALVIFLLTYMLIMSEMVHKTVAALIGALLMIVYGVVEYNSIGNLIDFKTLTVAVGMMITVNVVKKSGLFEYLSIKAAKLTKGNPTKLMITMVLLATIVSTFFSNITSTLILGTLIVSLCKILDLDFIPYLLIISFTVNIAGILTPVSSLPNIMVSTAAGLSFGDFAINLFILVVLLLASAILFFKVVFKKEFSQKISAEEKKKLMALDENKEIKNKKLFKRSIIILSLIVVFFLIQDFTGIGNEAVAITGAILMLMLSSADPEEMISEVQWSTIAFFVGLFIVIGGIEHVGLLEKMSVMISNFISTEFSAISTILVGSMTTSSIVDNIPITAILIPIIENLNQILQVVGKTLFYPLIVGAALGGNITPIGSPSNVLAMGIAEKNKRKIDFGTFIKYGGSLTIIHIIISLAYFYVRLNFF